RSVAPEIITTAPTMDFEPDPPKRKPRLKLPGRLKSPEPTVSSLDEATKSAKERRKTMSESGPSGSRSRVTFDEPENRPSSQSLYPSPPAYGDEASSTLA